MTALGEKKRLKRLVDHSLGLEVVIVNAPVVRVRGEWTLNVNRNVYREVVLRHLVREPRRMTGDQVAFVRKFFGMTSRAFAGRLGVKHTAVLKWESRKEQPTDMAWTTEKEIRMSILDTVEKSATRFREIWRALGAMEDEKGHAAGEIQIDGSDLAA